MYSGHKTPGRNSGSESERSGLTINLTVRGSPAPIYIQEPKTFREQKKTTGKPRKKKELSFPVDKIIYLAERLQLTSYEEKKIESVALTAIKPGNQAEPEVVCCHDTLSSGFDFSLDLSNISNVSDCVDFEETSADETCETSRPASVPREYFSPRRPPSECECTNSPGNHDLVHLYINSIENQEELVKYFRPCRNCNKACCVCPDSSSQISDKVSKAVETDSSVTGFDCDCTSVPSYGRRLRDSESCCSQVQDLFSPFWGEECSCSCRCDVSYSTDRIHSYTSSLARAAESARALVRDLEVILSGLDGATVK